MTDDTGRAPRLSTIKVAARGEEYRIVQLSGNLFVCSRANGNCCCGWEEKGRMPFDNSLWSDEWERRRIRNKLHLTFTGCLGPCATGNNALLQLYGVSIWLKDLNRPELPAAVFDWIEAMLAAEQPLEPPPGLRDHVFHRFLPGSGALQFTEPDPAAAGDGLEGIDPVCLMEVDPATARHRADYEGQSFVFCAPSCRKLFLQDPAAYLG